MREERALRVDRMTAILTADRTLMSDYHHNEFIGFGTCVAPNLIPDWLYKFLFFPPIKTNSGVPIAAPYGLRKIEAQLLSEGDVQTLGFMMVRGWGLHPSPNGDVSRNSPSFLS
jgi:hypothetical protein